MAERTFNNVPATAPWLVSANFIIARALIETGITNVGPSIPGSDGVGPLQVSTAEWKLLLATGNIFGVFDEIQRESSITQIYGAGFRMHRDAKAISDLKTPAPSGNRAAGAAALPPGEADRFIPSFLDVFNAYLSDSPAAAVSILDASNDSARQDTPLDAVLKPSMGEAEIAAFFTRREKYTGTRASPKTVKDYVAAVEAELNSALKKAYDMMKESAPEELMRVKQGEASWFDVALEEETKKIDEDNPAHKNIILDYFKATSSAGPGKFFRGAAPSPRTVCRRATILFQTELPPRGVGRIGVSNSLLEVSTFQRGPLSCCHRHRAQVPRGTSASLFSSPTGERRLNCWGAIRATS